MARVLLLGGGLQGLSAAFSLHREKHYVVLFTSTTDEANGTRLADKTYCVQKSSARTYYQQLIDIIREEQIDAVIPMGDKNAEFLSQHRDEIQCDTKCHCATTDYAIFIQGADKEKLMQFCEDHNFAHPRTREISIETSSEVAEYVGFPAMIKPNRSVGARGITLVRSQEELDRQLPSILHTYGESTLQEYIDCEGRPYYNVMLYRNAQGEILGQTIIEIMRYFPIKGGSSSLCRTVEIPALAKECIRILDAMGWVGMADFDVLQNHKGEYKIIEINPRVPASLRAADIAGINFPEIMVNDLLGLPQKEYHYQTNCFLRYLGLDLMWFMASPRRWSFRPNWFLSLGRNYWFQDIYAQDPHTWLTWLTGGIQRYLQKRKHLHR